MPPDEPTVIEAAATLEELKEAAKQEGKAEEREASYQREELNRLYDRVAAVETDVAEWKTQNSLKTEETLSEPEPEPSPETEAEPEPQTEELIIVTPKPEGESGGRKPRRKGRVHTLKLW